MLFGEAEPVGEQVRIGDSPFTVIGVLQPKIQNSSFSSRDEDRVFIPASTHAAIFGWRFVANLAYLAGVGVANIMYVVVRERTREIGVKLAVGGGLAGLAIAAVCAGILMAIGLVADILPARKAARLHPVESLRYE